MYFSTLCTNLNFLPIMSAMLVLRWLRSVLDICKNFQEKFPNLMFCEFQPENAETVKNCKITRKLGKCALKRPKSFGWVGKSLTGKFISNSYDIIKEMNVQLQKFPTITSESSPFWDIVHRYRNIRLGLYKN